jgi:hypothetical protein
MLYLDDLKYMRLYKKQFYLPINMDDKKHGSAILLLSPNYATSNSLMNHRLIINRSKSFESYYIEKDILYTIQNESRLLQCKHQPDGYGPVNEQAVFTETTDVACWDSLDEMRMNDLYCQLGNKIIFFNEMYDEDIFNESSAALNSKYKKLLYNDRIRNNKVVLNLYDKVKEDNPWIKRTYINYARYKSLNLFIDLYYYNQAYLTNNNFTITKSIDMYFEFIRRFIMDRRIDNAGYTKKTVFVPVYGWDVPDGVDILDFKKALNPLSVFFKNIRRSPEELKCFEGIDFVFFGQNGYFKYEYSHYDTSTDRAKFMRFMTTLTKNGFIDDDDEPDVSPAGITTDIVDKLQDNSGIVIQSLTGESNDVPVEDKKSNTKSATKDTTSTTKKTNNTSTTKSTTKSATTTVTDRSNSAATKNVELKNQLVKKINDAAKDSKTEDEALAKMEEDKQIKQIISDLQADSDTGPKISAARSSRITSAQDEFMKKQLNGVTVAQMVNNSNKPKELKKTALPIKTINEEWKELQAINFEKEYDLNADIVKILNSLSVNKTYPVNILDIETEDTSTSEDSIITYTVKCEDYSGKRFTLKFDIPKFRDNRFMRLRGNEKIFSIEMPLIPISKTDSDTVQIVSLYNKIFVFTNYTSAGKSNPFANKLSKALSKYKGKDIEITLGDNSKICAKYELPIDYIDLASQYSRIRFYSSAYGQTVTIYFNQDEIRKIPGVNSKNGIPIAMDASGKVAYYTGKDDMTVSEMIASMMINSNEAFKDLYEAQSVPKKSTYSVAKVLNTQIPIIVILAHDIGLTRAMSLAGINYTISDKKDKTMGWDSIKLSDGYINYQQTYDSMLLMNGLKECSLEDYSIKVLDSKMTWVSILDNFGGKIKSDGLDNFKDLMYDPITIEICQDYKLPTTYHEALIYASNLLVDNKHTVHKDLSTNRYRTNEVVAAQFYKAISDSYKDYALQTKHGRKANMTMKQSVVIDLILAQNTTSDLSIFQPLSEIETKNMISTKGVTGMNEDRAYKIDKRGYDDSMVNIIAQSTGFASTVGVNRQTTINPQIVGGRGYFKQTSTDDMNITNTLGMTEALSPFMLTSDDPFRNDMTFVQTSKHSTPIEYGTPLLVTTGADAAMPYLTSDMFAHKSKKKGKVVELTDEYMIVEYTDGDKEYINLSEQTMKNSDGGFYIVLQLKTDLKVGDSVKEGQILAYDKKSFSNRVGSTDPQLAYNLGCLTKVAIMTTEDGYEDSGVCSEWLSDTMSSDIVVMKSVTLPPMTNVLMIAKRGQKVREGDPVMIYQNAFDEDDASILLKNLNNEDGDVTEIGRNVIKSKVTGEISDIKIYRTCDLDEMSESLRKIISTREEEIRKKKSKLKGCSNDVHFDSSGKLPATGKLKNVDGILIEIYMKYHDKLSCGDKLTLNNANKCVLMNVFSDDEAPYTDFRPNEPIDQIGSASSLDGRMLTSTIKLGALNKAMVELQRSVCDIYGIPWKNIHEIKAAEDANK